jgi:hypothetical protein
MAARRAGVACGQDKVGIGGPEAGNERSTEVALLWTGEVVEVEMCRKSAAPPPVTVDQAVAGGCRTQSDISSVVQSTLARGDLGTTTRRPAGDPD